MVRFAFFLIWVLTGAVLQQRPALALDARLQVEGAALVLKLEDGRVLRDRNLVGMSLELGVGAQEITVRIDGFEEESGIPNEPLALYSMVVLGLEGQGPRPLCDSDPGGRRAALVVPGRDGGFTLTCTSGAEGKCVLFGYRPWQNDSAVPMAALHRACIHMLRADYGGDNRPATRNGTRINVFDRFGIQHPEPASGMNFEAAWGPEGAICVAHPRIAELVSLEDIGRRVPRLAGRLGPEQCTEAAMRADPQALVFNQSVDAAR